MLDGLWNIHVAADPLNVCCAFYGGLAMLGFHHFSRLRPETWPLSQVA